MNRAETNLLPLAPLTGTLGAAAAGHRRSLQVHRTPDLLQCGPLPPCAGRVIPPVRGRVGRRGAGPSAQSLPRGASAGERRFRRARSRASARWAVGPHSPPAARTAATRRASPRRAAQPLSRRFPRGALLLQGIFFLSIRLILNASGNFCGHRTRICSKKHRKKAPVLCNLVSVQLYVYISH